MTLGSQLVLIGSLLLAIPLAIVALLAIRESALGLTAVEEQQLAGGARIIADEH